jgi:hypothetical protein
MKKLLMLGTPLAVIAMQTAGEGSAAAAPAEKKPKKEKPVKPEKPAKITQNGVTRPAAGTKTARVWEIADAISASKGRPALREEVMAAGEAEGMNRGTIATQYARWTEFFAVSKEDRAAARAAEKPAPEPKPEPTPEPAAE